MKKLELEASGRSNQYGDPLRSHMKQPRTKIDERKQVLHLPDYRASRWFGAQHNVRGDKISGGSSLTQKYRRHRIS